MSPVATCARWLRPVRSSAMLAACLALAAPALGAQVVRGVVRDSATGRTLSASDVLIASARDSTHPCSVVTRDDGRFRCAMPAGSSIIVSVRHIEYAPLRFQMAAMTAGDSIDLVIALVPATVTLDTMRTVDTSYKHGVFWVTPGNVQFQRHMELGKGHFISGVDVQRSGMLLSEYLVAHFRDSLALVTTASWRSGPVVPVANNKFLTSTVKSRCLYVRIDRLSLPAALQAGGRGDNIDDILAPHDVIGVELYLDYHDVPAEWRMDAYPNGLFGMRRRNGTAYSVGDIGLGPGMGRGGGQPPTCPFLQIWTRMAWW